MSLPQKNFFWVGGVYTMQNNDTNTDYHKFVSVGYQKWEIIEITIGIIFLFFFLFLFFFAWALYSLLFIQGVFKPHHKKITSTESANSHPKSQFDLSLSYQNVLKNGSAPHHPGVVWTITSCSTRELGGTLKFLKSWKNCLPSSLGKGYISKWQHC